MSVKLIAALVLAGIAATLGGYWLGRVLGISSEHAQCAAANASAATGYASHDSGQLATCKAHASSFCAGITSRATRFPASPLGAKPSTTCV